MSRGRSVFGVFCGETWVSKGGLLVISSSFSPVSMDLPSRAIVSFFDIIGCKIGFFVTLPSPFSTFSPAFEETVSFPNTLQARV